MYAILQTLKIVYLSYLTVSKLHFYLSIISIKIYICIYIYIRNYFVINLTSK